MKRELTGGLPKLSKNELMEWNYRKVVEQMLVYGDGSESGGCNLAQVTPSTELQECAILKWEELMTWVGTMASMVVASMAPMVAWWRRWLRWLASIVDGGLGSSTQRALTWKSLCVPSGEDGTHSSSLFFALNRMQDVQWRLSMCLVVDSLLRHLA